MINKPEWITDSIWYKMCDAGMSLPEPLETADLTKPFVYDRKYGVFPVVRSNHQIAMSLLLAIHKGYKNGVDASEKMGLEYSNGTADHYLSNITGTAFLSSVGKCITAGSKNNLNEKEKDYFGSISYLDK